MVLSNIVVPHTPYKLWKKSCTSWHPILAHPQWNFSTPLQVNGGCFGKTSPEVIYLSTGGSQTTGLYVEGLANPNP